MIALRDRAVAAAAIREVRRSCRLLRQQPRQHPSPYVKGSALSEARGLCTVWLGTVWRRARWIGRSYAGAAMDRICSRVSCAAEAVATLSYDYRDQMAVLGPLAQLAEPHCYDLCARHAERTSAPHGWQLLRYAYLRSAV